MRPPRIDEAALATLRRRGAIELGREKYDALFREIRLHGGKDGYTD
jgi:hypothetical protein